MEKIKKWKKIHTPKELFQLFVFFIYSDDLVAFLDDTWLVCGLDEFFNCETNYSYFALYIPFNKKKSRKKKHNQIKLLIFNSERRDKNDYVLLHELQSKEGKKKSPDS